MYEQEEQQEPPPQGEERLTKTEWVLAQSPDMSRVEVAKRAVDAGYLGTTPEHVSKIRWNANNPQRGSKPSQVIRRTPPPGTIAALIRQFPIDTPVGEVAKYVRANGHRKKTIAQLKPTIWSTRVSDKHHGREDLYAKAPPERQLALAPAQPEAPRRGRPPNATRPAQPPGAGKLPALSDLDEDETRLAQMIMGMGIRRAARILEVVQNYVVAAFQKGG